MPHAQPPAHPDWAVDALFELEDPLPGCYRQLLPQRDGVAYVGETGPGEATAKRPSRGRRPKHSHRV